MRITNLSLITGICFGLFIACAQAFTPSALYEFPKNSFENSHVDPSEILSGGPPRDGIPAVDDPQFISVTQAEDIPDPEAVVRLEYDGVVRAYPIRVLMWHEIVNDRINGHPIAVTYCPLCNAAIAFDARLNGQDLDFGTTGRLRFSDLIMYDRQTETWWQQFSGAALVGDLVEEELKMVPVRMESMAQFRKTAPQHAEVLATPNNFERDYGRNPYTNYDLLDRPFLYSGEYDSDLPMMSRVVVVNDMAWSYDLVRTQQTIISGPYTISWMPGMASPLQTRRLDQGRDIGQITVMEQSDSGLKPVVHDVTFAFVFKAFHPDQKIIVQ